MGFVLMFESLTSIPRIRNTSSTYGPEKLDLVAPQYVLLFSGLRPYDDMCPLIPSSCQPPPGPLPQWVTVS
jgi:hypothetical protein